MKEPSAWSAICEYKAWQKSDLEKHKESAHEQIKQEYMKAQQILN